MKNYYIFSLKWSQKHLPVFNWWQADASGYAMIVKTTEPERLYHAGVYTEETVQGHTTYYDNRDTTIAIPVEVVEPFLVTAQGIDRWKILDGQQVVMLDNEDFRKVILEYVPDWKGPRK